MSDSKFFPFAAKKHITVFWIAFEVAVDKNNMLEAIK